LKILLLTHTFNSLCQRVFLELQELGHEVSIEFDIDDAVLEEAVALFSPELIIAPFLKRAIPKAVWERKICIVIHPGILGDRGPSSLDWAILNHEAEWGVTALQANAEMDGGDVWGHVCFSMRPASKGSLYRGEVTEAAAKLVRQVVSDYERGLRFGKPLAEIPEARGVLRPLVKQKDRRINWEQDEVESVLRNIRSGDGSPGVLDCFLGKDVYIFGAHPESRIVGVPGEILARRDGAVCRACADGSVWISHMQEKRVDMSLNREAPGRGVKLPSEMILGALLECVPEIPVPLRFDPHSWQEIFYRIEDEIAYLHFEFLNGAMGVRESEKLLAAFREVRNLRPRAIVLMGGRDFWSNGIHLNLIEMASSAPEASLENIQAINRVAREILCSSEVLTVAALQGNAGSGGCFLALACDFVFARDGVVLNPHYKNMGNLYGSEFWTYVLPRRMGAEGKKRVMERRLPLSAREACNIGFLDAVLPSEHEQFFSQLHERLCILTTDSTLQPFFQKKSERRNQDESFKSLDAYESEELAQMRRNFFGFDPSYHVARYNFVFKIPHSRTPLHLARHRQTLR
jgi:putative two-component system hydrogenase maturation factor HypX/HoxX